MRRTLLDVAIAVVGLTAFGLLLWLDQPGDLGTPRSDEPAVATTDSYPSAYDLRACKADLERMEQATGFKVEWARMPMGEHDRRGSRRP